MPKNKNFEDVFEVYAEGVKKRVGKTLDQMARELKDEMIKNSSLEDEHTPNELKRLGHPYTHENLHDTPIVHRQPDPKRGKYKDIHISDNIEIFASKRKDTLLVGVDPEKVPYIEWVINGSTKLISRDFLAYSILNLNKRFRKIIKQNLKSKKQSNRRN